jgi:hypothetical protein
VQWLLKAKAVQGRPAGIALIRAHQELRANLLIFSSATVKRITIQVRRKIRKTQRKNRRVLARQQFPPPFGYRETSRKRYLKHPIRHQHQALEFKSNP